MQCIFRLKLIAKHSLFVFPPKKELELGRYNRDCANSGATFQCTLSNMHVCMQWKCCSHSVTVVIHVGI